DAKTQRPFKARYIGCMAADVHRTLLQGGIFMYPDSTRYPNGKLRLMYECNPLSFIIEQAGGLATDGKRRILEIQPKEIHECTPVYIGSKINVEKLQSFLAEEV
ncbi:MAG: class 1 fructose-bisphosphatase, partial [Balneolaceae bacterium]